MGGGIGFWVVFLLLMGVIFHLGYGIWSKFGIGVGVIILYQIYFPLWVIVSFCFYSIVFRLGMWGWEFIDSSCHLFLFLGFLPALLGFLRPHLRSQLAFTQSLSGEDDTL